MKSQSRSLRYRLVIPTFTNRTRVDDVVMISMKMRSRVPLKIIHSAVRATPRSYFSHVRRSVNIRSSPRGTSRASESLRRRSLSDRTAPV